MADTEPLTNGVNGDVPITTTEEEHASPPKKPDNTETEALTAQIEELEKALSTKATELEKSQTEKETLAAELEALTGEVTALKEERDSRERAVSEITKRAFDLEGQVVRLEHDFISTLSESRDWQERAREKELEAEQSNVKARRAEEKLKVSEGKVVELGKKVEESEKKVVERERDVGKLLEVVKGHENEKEEKEKVKGEEKKVGWCGMRREKILGKDVSSVVAVGVAPSVVIVGAGIGVWYYCHLRSKMNK